MISSRNEQPAYSLPKQISLNLRLPLRIGNRNKFRDSSLPWKFGEVLLEIFDQDAS
jgi:hypothetical protein